MKAHTKNNEIKGNSFRNLLVLLMFYITCGPFLIPYPSLAIIAHGALTMFLFFAVYTVQKKQSQRQVVMVLLFPLLVLYWLGIYSVVDFSLDGAYLLFVVYYGLLIYSYTTQIKRSRRVTRNVLYASFCLYLTIGLFFGAIFGLINTLMPGSYSGTLLSGSENGVMHAMHVFNYFSFITLTSLGYGDITPQTSGAAAICQVEAVIGQFFSAVLVAWLVAKYMIDGFESDDVVN